MAAPGRLPCGAADRQALESTIALLQRGNAVLIAPEGTRHPRMADPKDGTTYVATKANAVIQPIGLDGTDQFLDSLLRLRRTPVTVRFGRPFRFCPEGRARIPRDELRLMTREMMYQVALLVPEQRRGIYRPGSAYHRHPAIRGVSAPCRVRGRSPDSEVRGQGHA